VSHRFVTLDVFTDEVFAGNRLAVVWDADDLDDATLASIAREFDYSETVFLQSPTVAGCDVRTRIFTPGRELPFAGHPTIGTAVALAAEGAGPHLRFDQGAGPLDVVAAGGRARFTVEREVVVGPPGEVPAEVLGPALGLDPGDVAAGGRATSAGTPFLVAEVPDLDVLARARPPAGLGHEVFVVCRVGPHAWRARMFAPDAGIPEDPATGSAATAFAGVLAEAAADGRHQWVIEQGVEMGRPSRIEVAAEVHGGRLRRIEVAGAAVVVMEGTLRV